MSYYPRATQLLPICQGAARAGCSLWESETPVSAKSSDCHMAIAIDECTAIRHVQNHTGKSCRDVRMKTRSGDSEQVSQSPVSSSQVHSDRQVCGQDKVRCLGQGQDPEQRSRWAGMGMAEMQFMWGPRERASARSQPPRQGEGTSVEPCCLFLQYSSHQ